MTPHPRPLSRVRERGDRKVGVRGEETLGCIFKYNDDIEAFRQGNLVALLEQADIDKQM